MVELPIWAVVLLCLGAGFTAIVLIGVIVLLLGMICACIYNTIVDCKKEKYKKSNENNSPEEEAPYFVEPKETGSDK